MKNYIVFDLNNNQVYSHNSKNYLKPYLTTNYYSIGLYKNSKLKQFQFHRLVYEAHNGTIPIGLFIDHIDNNKLNNHIDNLRLCNRSENNCNRKVSKNNISGYKKYTFNKM